MSSVLNQSMHTNEHRKLVNCRLGKLPAIPIKNVSCNNEHEHMNRKTLNLNGKTNYIRIVSCPKPIVSREEQKRMSEINI